MKEHLIRESTLPRRTTVPSQYCTTKVTMSPVPTTIPIKRALNDDDNR